MDESAGRFQFRLGDLAVLVVGSAYFLDVVRRTKGAWSGGIPDSGQVLGLILVALGVALGSIVLGQGVRRVRDPRRQAWSLTWRLLGLGALAWLMGEVELTLQPKLATTMRSANQAELCVNVNPLATSLALVGLLLAASPPGPRLRAPKLKPGWSSRLSILLAVVAGVAVVSVGFGVFPYLVMLALEFVQNALPRAPRIARPHVFDRLNLASLEALPALAGCLLTAIWIDDDLRSVASDPLQARTPRSWLGRVWRVATVVLASAGSVFVLVSSIPRLSDTLAEGIGAIFDPSSVATIALGFAGLAAGISASSAANLADLEVPGDPPTRRVEVVWLRRFLGGIFGLFLLEVFLVAVLKIRGDFEDHWYALFHLSPWTSSFAYPLIDKPGLYLIGLLAAWLLYRMIRGFAAKAWVRPSALDLVASDRLALGRFLGWWVGLTIVMLASLPVLGVIGVTLTHHVIRWVAK